MLYPKMRVFLELSQSNLCVFPLQPPGYPVKSHEISGGDSTLDGSHSPCPTCGCVLGHVEGSASAVEQFVREMCRGGPPNSYTKSCKVQLGTSEAFRVKWRLGKLFFDHRFKEAPHKKDAISSNTYWDSNLDFFEIIASIFNILSLHKYIYIIYIITYYNSWLILDGCSMFVCIPGNPVTQ